MSKDDLTKDFVLGLGVDTFSPANTVKKNSSILNLCGSKFPWSETRPGTSLHSTLPGSGTVHGLFVFGHPKSAVTPVLVAGRGGITYVHAGDSWAAVSGGGSKSTSAYWDAVNFGSSLIITNGFNVPFDVHVDATYHSVPYSTAPVGPFIVADTNRIFIAAAFLLSWCMINIPTDWASTGVDGAGSQTLAQDTDKPMMALSDYGGIMVHREDSIAEMIGLPNSSNVAILEVPTSFGCIAQHSLVRHREKQYFWGREGIAEVQVGLTPSIISQPVQYWVDLVNQDATDRICGHLVNDRELWMAIPTGVSTVPDTILVYDTLLGEWYVYEGIWHPISFIHFNHKDYMLSSDGKVYELNSGVTDDGTAIAWELVTAALENQGEMKFKRVILGPDAGHFNFQYSPSVDEDDWSTAVAVTDDSHRLKISLPPTSADLGYGDYFRMKLSGTGVVSIRGATLRYRVRSING